MGNGRQLLTGSGRQKLHVFQMVVPEILLGAHVLLLFHKEADGERMVRGGKEFLILRVGLPAGWVVQRGKVKPDAERLFVVHSSQS